MSAKTKLLKKVASLFDADLDAAKTKKGDPSKGQMKRADGSTYALMGDDLLRIQSNIDQYKGSAKTLGLLSAPALFSFTSKKSEPLEDKEEASEFEKAFSKAFKEGEDTFTFKGKEYTTELKRGKKNKGSLIGGQKEIDANDDGDITAEDFAILRDRKEEGGMPVDTYPNIPEDEMAEAEASQLPDDEMEDNYIKFVMDESLNDEEQDYLAEALTKDDRLSDILDKVIVTAGEFSGAGEVDGPGTGVSDSIPARLSDGEFVFTKKATDQLGADNLQRMMDDAERAYDGGLQRMNLGGMATSDDDEEELEGRKYDLSKTDEEIRKLMIGANKMPSVQ